MNQFNNNLHLVQTPLWGDFKSMMGTPPIRVGEMQFTKHKIPFTPYYVGYAPRVNFRSQHFSWKELESKARSEKCSVVRFDVPNIIKETVYDNEKWYEELKERCVISPKSTFAKWNVLMDIKPNEESLIKNLHPKTRYNSKLAAKKGVVVRIENNEKGIKILVDLLSETSKRQGFLIHSNEYYQKVFEVFNSQNKGDILVAYLNDQPLGAWLVLMSDDTVYYPYGGSSNEHRNLMSSALLGWEAIKLGKRKGCSLFDMWGATNDRNSPWWGFTQFKLRYGGELVEYIDSYDYVINPLIYKTFNFSYNTFWKARKLFLKTSGD